MTVVGGPPGASGTDDPLLGRVLSERYRILRKLGEGGMGVVYLAEHVVIEKKIALKVLFPDLTRRADLVQRFIQEAKSASRIGHENVIDITDFGQSPEGYVFLAMEYLSGQDLGQVLKTSGPMGWPRAQPMLVQIGKALRAAHEGGIIHRDMKPENIFVIPRDDGREFIKVLDFGIAKVMGLDEDAPRLTRTGMIFGTPEYMSPEQAQGQHVDHRVDIYAVGCIMYQILTGTVPFQAETFMGILSKHMMEAPEPPRRRNPSIDPAVEAIILKAMEKDPAKRYQSMRDFVAALAPQGSSADLSGSISLSTGVSAPRTVVPVSPSRPGTVSERPRAGAVGGRHAAVRSSTPDAPLAPLEPLPFATHEMKGRASLPLAAANPEVRRSRTELFDRPGGDPLAERPSSRPRGSSNLLLFGGVAVVLAAGALVFYLKQKPAPAAAAPIAPAAVAPAATVAPGPRADSNAMPKTEPGSAATGEGTAAAGAAATGTKKVGASAVDATAEGDTKADGKKKSTGRRHRSSREAIESLGVPKGGAEPAPAHEHEGTRTPAELKNPFQPQP
ncbi:MAG TPA: serine/threonine-protein kinase [Polyangia bacterium]